MASDQPDTWHMLRRITTAPTDDDGGFTLIELLVVMIIIGVLAAIAVPVFLNQRAKAQDSAAKSDVSKLGKEIATYWVDGTTVPSVDTTTIAGHYALVAASTTTDLGVTSAGVSLAGQQLVDDTHWCIAVTNSKGSVQTYKYSAKGGLSAGACTAADVA